MSKLRTTTATNTHLVYREVDGVVKDAVKSIEVLGVEAHLKLYDVTVPSTLNFQVANGLQCRDTSETGYLQRRLIKAMEDCKINHDLTVRNANGYVVQFLYGEDGMDAIKLQNHELGYLRQSPAEMRGPYLLSSAEELRGHVRPELQRRLAASEAEWRPRLEAHFGALVDDRRAVIMGWCGGVNDAKPITYPVHIGRLIETVQDAAKAAGCLTEGLSDLDPLRVLDAIDALTAELRVGAEPGPPPGEVQWMPVLLRAFLSPKVLLCRHHLSAAGFDQVVRNIRESFYGAVANPGEMVGIVAAQSLGEPCTQLVLNSVHYDTDLLLRVGGKLTKVKIGEFTEAAVEARKGTAELEAHPHDTWLGWLHPGPEQPLVEVMSVNEEGKMSWNRVEAVTKHPVVNKDGSNTLLHVTLRSGREVIATKAKSFLKRVDNRIVGVDGDALRVGDYLPVSRVFLTDGTPEVTHLEVADYVPKTEFVFMSEVEKAKAARARCSRAWWKAGLGTEFVLPYKRGDAFVEAQINKVGVRSGNDAASADVVKKSPCECMNNPAPCARCCCCCCCGCSQVRQAQDKQQYLPDCVYPLYTSAGGCAVVGIPERLVLDAEFGQFVGQFLADGHANQYHIIISKNDDGYRAAAAAYLDRLGVVHHTVTQRKNGGTTTDLRGTSKVLARVLRLAFGELSHQKRFPTHLLAAPLPFIKGVLSGYFAGDGTVHVRDGAVSASSTSRELLEAVQQMLLRFDITSSMSFRATSDAVAARHLETHDMWILRIACGSALRFAHAIPLCIQAKQEALGAVIQRWEQPGMRRYTYGQLDVIPEVVLSSGTQVRIQRDELRRRARAYAVSAEDVEVIRRILEEEEVLYDEVVNIIELPNSRSHVYDLTVEGTRNFNVFSGLTCNDTFHSTGSSSATQVTAGVPRMRELMSMSKNIKTPSMNIYLRPEWAGTVEHAKEAVSQVQTTLFRDLVNASAVYYDPADDATTVQEDREMLEFYHRFTRAMGAECAPDANTGHAAPWVLRFELDRARMLDLQVSMLDVECVLADFYADTVACVMSDDNAARLVCRLRLTVASSDVASNDLLTEIKALEQSIMENLVIKGVRGVSKAIPVPPTSSLQRYDPALDAFTPDTEWSVVTAGSNMMDVLCLDRVDTRRTVTNDVFEVYQTLGIEAGRAALIIELRKVLIDLSLDHRHISLLGDTMSNRGFFMSIDRHGINARGELGPLAKCSFEQTDAMLINAGVFAERDRINGVSANVMLGQIAPCGTGDCEVLMDNDAIERLVAPVPLDVGAPRPAAATPAEDPRNRKRAVGVAAPALELPDISEDEEEGVLDNEDDDDDAADELQIV